MLVFTKELSRGGEDKKRVEGRNWRKKTQDHVRETKCLGRPRDPGEKDNMGEGHVLTKGGLRQKFPSPWSHQN